MRFRFHSTLGPLTLAGVAVIAAATALAQPDPAGAEMPPAHAAASTTSLARATPAQLKTAYLECERLAMTTLLDFGTAAGCSLVYEELKRRVFGGDFERLRLWSIQQPQPGSTAALAGSPGGAAEAP